MDTMHNKTEKLKVYYACSYTSWCNGERRNTSKYPIQISANQPA